MKLLIEEYPYEMKDVNFLYVLSLYAKNKASEKNAWREKIRQTFRDAVMDMLGKKYDFYALAAHPDVNANQYFKSHFQETLGKTFRPYPNQSIFSLKIQLPTMRLSLCNHNKFGDLHSKIPNPKNWNVQVHSYSEVMQQYKKGFQLPES